MKKSLFFYCFIITTIITPTYSIGGIWHNHFEPIPRTNSFGDTIKDIRFLYKPHATDFDDKEEDSFDFFTTNFSNSPGNTEKLTPEQKFTHTANWILTFYLFKYALNGNLQALEELLQNFPNLNLQVKDTLRKAPIDYARDNNHTNCVELLESYSFRPEFRPHRTAKWEDSENQSDSLDFGSPSYRADDELDQYILFGCTSDEERNHGNSTESDDDIMMY